MAYTNFQHCTEEEYTQIIYSQGADNKLKILFDGVELEDADRYCESLKLISRILPDDATKRFSLDNFVAKEMDLVLHKVDESVIKDQVEISIGTLVESTSLGDTYEYVPLGIFNIQDKPTTDKDKITIKLRDNRVKFDFNYDGKPLIDENGGTATKLQIFQDICEQAGVDTDIESFLGDSDEVGIYDNTVTATTYISYLAEQAGCIASIDREGKLIFIDVNDLATQRIPLSIVEKYDKEKPFTIERVVYEDAIRKFQSSDDETLDTLFINSANPYISEQQQIDAIYENIENFQMDSVTTGKILGNPAIDNYDIIEVYDDYSEEEEKPIVFSTLANHTLTYRGVMIAEYKTKIGLEARTENVTLKGEPTFRKWARTEIDNVNAEITIQAGQIQETQEDLQNNYYDKSNVDTLLITAAEGVTNTFSEAGGNNIFRNTGLWFTATSTEFTLFPSQASFPSDETFMGNKVMYEYWNGETDKIKEEKAANLIAMRLKKGEINQEQSVPNGNYTISFKYKKLIELSTVFVQINGIRYDLTATDDTEFVQTIEVNSQHINVSFTSDIENACEIYDLMVNAGSVKLAYSQNQNETTTETVNISKGITIKSTNTDTTFRANADGIRTLDRSENVLTEFTDEGMITKKMIVQDQSQIVGLLVQEVGDQTWITRL